MSNENEGTVNQRLALLIDTFERGSKAAFASKIGVTAQSVHDLIGGRKGTPSFKMLSSILESYPTVDANWLVLGRGSMLHEETPPKDSGQALPYPHSELLMDMVKKEVAEQMAEARPNEDVYKLLNDEMAQTRAQYALSWEEEADALRKKRDAFGDAQISTAFELTARIEEIERAISVLENIKPGPNGLAPSIAYRVGPKPDFSKPFDGLLSRRLNISESEAKELVTRKTGVGFSVVTSAPGYGYEVSEVAVQHFLRWHAHHLKQS